MGKPYRFTSPSEQSTRLTHKECKDTGCHCCSARPVKDFIEELGKRMKACGLTPQKEQLLPPGGFDEKGSLNPFEIVAYLYRTKFMNGLDNCLERKTNVKDCIYGCNSGIINPEKPLKHPHQSRVYNFYPNALPNMTTLISGIIEEQSFEDFEGIVRFLYRQKKATKDKTSGFGNLSIYDAALRLAWHSSKNKEERATLLPKKVWLQQGAWDGADYLDKLGKLSNPPHNHPGEGLRHYKVSDRTDFPAPIAALEPYHIENLLCIFHPLFKKWTESN